MKITLKMGLIAAGVVVAVGAAVMGLRQREAQADQGGRPGGEQMMGTKVLVVAAAGVVAFLAVGCGDDGDDGSGGLEAAGFRVALPERIPCNDGGLSYGQVAEYLGRLR